MNVNIFISIHALPSIKHSAKYEYSGMGESNTHQHVNMA